MTASTLLVRLGALGVSITADGASLHLRPASAIPPDLLSDLRSYKQDLVALLAANDHGTFSPTTPEQNEALASGDCKATRSRPDWRVRECEHRAIIADEHLQAAQRRPPSWADHTAVPPLGCFCSCCKGRRWWCEQEAPRGWRCGSCHPPCHLS